MGLVQGLEGLCNSVCLNINCLPKRMHHFLETFRHDLVSRTPTALLSELPCHNGVRHVKRMC